MEKYLKQFAAIFLLIIIFLGLTLILNSYSQEDQTTSYIDLKNEMLHQGFEVVNSDNPSSAGIGNFPEIGDCGYGRDAMCSVSFKKSDRIETYYVALKENSSGDLYWYVVANAKDI